MHKYSIKYSLKLLFFILYYLSGNILVASVTSVYENKTDGFYETINKFNISLKKFPKVASQGNLGFCSSFSVRTLLEYHNCRVNGIDCNNKSLDDSFSILDIASYKYKESPKLEIAGFVSRILKNIEENTDYLSVESCAPYEQLNYDYTTYDKKTYKKQLGGWEFLKSVFDLYVNDNDYMKKNISSLIKHEMNIKIPKSGIVDNLNDSNNVGSFLFKTLVPEHCRDAENTKSLVRFSPDKIKSLVGFNNYKKYVLFKVYHLLKNKIPVNINFCSTKYIDPKTKSEKCNYHASVIKGLKKVCREDKRCEFLVQFHNSYGEKWQKEHDNGWQRLNPILDDLLLEEALDWVIGPDTSILALSTNEKKWLRNKSNSGEVLIIQAFETEELLLEKNNISNNLKKQETLIEVPKVQKTVKKNTDIKITKSENNKKTSKRGRSKRRRKRRSEMKKTSFIFDLKILKENFVNWIRKF